MNIDTTGVGSLRRTCVICCEPMLEVRPRRAKLGRCNLCSNKILPLPPHLLFSLHEIVLGTGMHWNAREIFGSYKA